MRAVLVVNPRATATTAAGRDVLARALASLVKLDVVETDYRGHALNAATQAMVDGADLVVAHGGDGTVNEVVNGLLARGVNTTVPMLGIVPGGSANVFARSLGLARDPVEATHQLLHALADRRSRRVSLGRVHANGDGPGRWFTFAAGVGWDADVVASVERKRGKRTSPTMYARIAVARYVRPSFGRPRLTVAVPGEQEITGLRLVFVSNTDPWTYFGSRPIHLNRGAGLDTDLGLFALHSLRLPTVLKHLRQAISRKGELRGRKLLRADDVPAVRVTTEQPVPLQCDGDLVGKRTCVEFGSVRDAITVAG